MLTWLPGLCLIGLHGGSGGGPGSGSDCERRSGGGGGEGDAAGGSSHTPDQPQGASQPQHYVLRRFVFEEVGAVELLGAVLPHLHILPDYDNMHLFVASALCLLAAAFLKDVRRRMAAIESVQGGSSSSSVKGGAKGRWGRGAGAEGAAGPHSGGS